MNEKTLEEKYYQDKNLIRLMILIILVMGIGFGILNYKYQTLQQRHSSLSETLLLVHNVSEGAINGFNACSKAMEELTDGELNCGYITSPPSVNELQEVLYIDR